MKDKVFQSYIQKAGKIKDALKRDATRKLNSQTIKKETLHQRKPYSFPVYWAMHRVRKTSSKKETIIIALLGGPSLFAAFYFFIGTAEWPVTPFLFNARIVTAAIVFAWLIYILRLKIYCLFTYPLYINWDKKLHFRLTGWQILVTSPRFIKLCYWRTGCSITITVSDNTKEFRELIHSIFYLFCHRTRPVYEAFESESSEEWAYDNYTLKGRCNSSIAGYIYAMIKNDLNKIAGATGAIKEISITCGETEKEFAKVSFTSDSEGTSS